ncbi:unnamed protein product [Echinostoma caproni]|uniref:Protein HGH1 homolog n=1 Tax=Echinostoma caproni TaxID=27848 RepID=A0A3P8HPD9_9TREM|nr:unnamed protein product [Echinostoma caproni]
MDTVQLVLKCLINLCSTTARNQLLFDTFEKDQARSDFVKQIANLWLSCPNADEEISRLALSLLCNLTRDPCWSSMAIQEDPKTLLDCIFRTDEMLTSSLPFLLNLTSQREIRKRISITAQSRTHLISLLLSPTVGVNQALLVTGILKNCFFDDDYHLLWLAPQSQLLDGLLRPLCGPQDDIDDEDRQKLPPGLRQVAGSKQAKRTESNDLKQTICEALLQLCATSEGRTRLRDCGTYFVLRELHKFENSKLSDRDEDVDTNKASDRSRTNEIVYHIEQVVDQLICKEEERDRYSVENSLRNIDVDAETSAKLDRAKQEFISTC